MTKMILAVSTLLFSIIVYAANTSAASSDLANTINKSIQNKSGSTQSSAIIYGGKDIARSMVVG